ncbi:MAG: glycosyltransferase, partial [Planctomycetota bacterium]|nr:glycosyltransferase [Planctomycetota bacterium]
PECVAGPYGTPRCGAGRIHGLLALGHDVVLATYPFGEDIRAPGLRIVRAPHAPLVRRVPVGPSVSKLLQDIPLFRTAARLLREERFDLLHTHEEAAYFGVFLARRAGIPHLYDMHSSLPEGFGNYGWHLGPLLPVVRAAERWVLRNVDGAIAVCPVLAGHARSIAPGLRVTVVENAPFDMLSGRDDLPEEGDAPGKAEAPPLYCGGLDRNQGADLLIRAAAIGQDLPPVEVYGGRPDQVEAARRMAESLGIADRIRLRGQAPFDVVWGAMRRSSALLSPRASGTNVPSKVYYYLRAGRPIVATDIPAHRQVLDGSCALLVRPDPEEFAAGLARVLNDQALASAMASAARRRYEERHTFRTYLEGLRTALAPWTGGAAKETGTGTGHAEDIWRRLGACEGGSLAGAGAKAVCDDTAPARAGENIRRFPG